MAAFGWSLNVPSEPVFTWSTFSSSGPPGALYLYVMVIGTSASTGLILPVNGSSLPFLRQARSSLVSTGGGGGGGGPFLWVGGGGTEGTYVPQPAPETAWVRSPA